MKANIKEIIAAILLITVSVLLFFVIKNQREIIAKQNSIETSIIEQKQLANDIIRAKSSYVTGDQLQSLLKENKIDIKKDLDTLRADVKGMNVTVIKTIYEKQTDVPSDGHEVKPGETVSIDKFGYLNNRQYINVSEQFADKQVPFGKVGFSAWKEMPWDKEVFEREYRHVGVLSYDKDGKGYYHNKFSVKVDGKEYDIKIDNSSFYEEFPSNHWGFHPRVFVGAGFGSTLPQPKFSSLVSGGVALFYNGKTSTDPDWIFAIPGIGYDVSNRKVNGELGLAYYNIGHHLPLVDNIFLGPSIGVSFDGKYSILVGLKFGL